MSSSASFGGGKPLNSDNQPGGSRASRCSLNVPTSSARKSKRKLMFTSDTLRGEKLYLYLKNTNLDQRSLEEDVGVLGGTVEKFLSKDVTYVVVPSVKSTDSRLSVSKGKNSPDFLNNPLACSRGRALLLRSNKSKATSSPNSAASCDPVNFAKKWGIKVMLVKELQDLISKEKSKLDDSVCSPEMALSNNSRLSNRGKSVKSVKPKELTGCFVKVEDESRKYRVLSQQFKQFECVHISSQGMQSPFQIHVQKVLSSSPKSDDQANAVPEAKSKTKTLKKVTKNPPGQGYCECCDVMFKDMKTHCASKRHQDFAEDKENYMILDDTIDRLPDFNNLTEGLVSPGCDVTQIDHQPHSSTEAFNLCQVEDKSPNSHSPTSVTEQGVNKCHADVIDTKDCNDSIQCTDSLTKAGAMTVDVINTSHQLSESDKLRNAAVVEQFSVCPPKFTNHSIESICQISDISNNCDNAIQPLASLEGRYGSERTVNTNNHNVTSHEADDLFIPNFDSLDFDSVLPAVLQDNKPALHCPNLPSENEHVILLTPQKSRVQHTDLLDTPPKKVPMSFEFDENLPKSEVEWDVNSFEMPDFFCPTFPSGDQDSVPPFTANGFDGVDILKFLKTPEKKAPIQLCDTVIVPKMPCDFANSVISSISNSAEEHHAVEIPCDFPFIDNSGHSDRMNVNTANESAVPNVPELKCDLNARDTSGGNNSSKEPMISAYIGCETKSTNCEELLISDNKPKELLIPENKPKQSGMPVVAPFGTAWDSDEDSNWSIDIRKTCDNVISFLDKDEQTVNTTQSLCSFLKCPPAAGMDASQLYPPMMTKESNQPSQPLLARESSQPNPPPLVMEENFRRPTTVAMEARHSMPPNVSKHSIDSGDNHLSPPMLTVEGNASIHPQPGLHVLPTESNRAMETNDSNNNHSNCSVNMAHLSTSPCLPNVHTSDYEHDVDVTGDSDVTMNTTLGKAVASPVCLPIIQTPSPGKGDGVMEQCSGSPEQASSSDSSDGESDDQSSDTESSSESDDADSVSEADDKQTSTDRVLEAADNQSDGDSHTEAGGNVIEANYDTADCATVHVDGVAQQADDTDSQCTLATTTASTNPTSASVPCYSDISDDEEPCKEVSFAVPQHMYNSFASNNSSLDYSALDPGAFSFINSYSSYRHTRPLTEKKGCDSDGQSLQSSSSFEISTTETPMQSSKSNSEATDPYDFAACENNTSRSTCSSEEDDNLADLHDFPRNSAIHSQGMWRVMPTSELKVKFCKVLLTPVNEDKVTERVQWKVQSSGACKLTFSTQSKRRSDSDCEHSNDDNQPIIKRRKLMY